MRSLIFAILATFSFNFVYCAPNSLVLARFGRQVEQKENSETTNKASDTLIHEFHINSNISNRFAKTLVTSKVKNADTKSKEATFTVVLPEKAFISGFVMEIDGKSYEAYVKEKEEAKNIYDQAVQSGQSAGHVAVSARDSNRFTVSINIEPESKATFLLTYEELLERRNNQYELVLNIHPGQIVKDLNIEVFVNESRPLKYVRTPSLRSGNEISKKSDTLDPSSDIQIINSTSAVAKFKPDVESQKKFAEQLGGKENEGLAGQFVLQYDVERDPRQGEVLLKDGYFVHFFAPEDLEPLPKHVVFVLDTSGSMSGPKLNQLKDAMSSILDELKEVDTFHIVEFNSNIYVWDIDTENRTQVYIQNEKEPFEDLLKTELPAAISATKEATTKGKSVIQKLQDDGLTNMLSSLETALHLVRVNLKKGSKHNQPIVIFLTDGEPTMGISDPTEITNIITRFNSDKDHVPIFSLSFGDGADKSFLRKLSLKNLGFSRHIYEAADASLQLQEFYKQISSPLLSNIEFEYTDVAEVSKKIFPIYFNGSEIVVAGKYDEGFDVSKCGIKYNTYKGQGTIKSVSQTPVSSLERLWAYLTVKQKLEEREIADNKTKLTKEALDLALKYSFVTDVSSLVVVKPNETNAVNTVNNKDAATPSAFNRRPGLFAQSAPASGFNSQGIPLSALQCSSNCRPEGLIVSDFYPTTTHGGFGFATHNPPTTVLTTSKDDTADSTTPIPSEGPLPWLSSVLHPNKTISILGGEYDLGENRYIPPSVECPATPLNSTEPGYCHLLWECQEVHKYLTDFQVYEKFACILENKFAGVCCPKVRIPL